MYFVSRGGHFYAFCMQLTPWQRYGLTVFSLISIVLCWHYCIYMPLEDIVAGYQHRIASAEQTHNMAQDAHIKLENQKKQLHRLEKQLKTKLPSRLEEDSVNTLAHYAYQSGLLLRSCSCTGYQNVEWYKEASLLFDAAGSTDQLIAFFDLLTQSTRIYGCSSVEIKELENNSVFQIRCLFSECLNN